MDLEMLEDPQGRVKSSLRLHYEAQVKVIRGQLGDLEKIREDLGLSQRKMAQLLLVDPSAWTRWTKRGEEAPPHVWRALQWYSALREKIPGLTPHYFTGTDPRLLESRLKSKIEEERQAQVAEMAELRLRLRDLERETERLRKKARRSLLGVGFFMLLLTFLLAGQSVRAETEEVTERPSRFLIPLVYYTPETKVAAGGLLIQNFGPPRPGRTSSLIASVSVTALGQFFVNALPRYYPGEGLSEVSGIVMARYFPGRYFGRGLQFSNEKGEKYVERSLDLGLNHAWNFSGPWSLRWGLQYENRRILESEAGGLVEAEGQNYSTSWETPSGSLSLERDTRDYPQAPLSGSWGRAIVHRYLPRDLEGQKALKAYTKTDLDLRSYHQQQEGRTIGTQFFASEVVGSQIPFTALNSIGGGSRLRGFYGGRFRERSLVMAQAEWRQEFREKWAWTAGGGVGRLASTLHQIPSARDLWAGAVGVHYIADRQNRTKIRADLGFAQEPGFYLLIGEAF